MYCKNKLRSIERRAGTYGQISLKIDNSFELNPESYVRARRWAWALGRYCLSYRLKRNLPISSRPTLDASELRAEGDYVLAT